MMANGWRFLLELIKCSGISHDCYTMLFLFKHLITALKGRVIETEGDADREIFHPLVYSPNETGYVQSQEPGAAAGSPYWAQGPSPWTIFRCFLRHNSREMNQSGVSRTRTSTHIGFGVTGGSLTHCLTVPTRTHMHRSTQQAEKAGHRVIQAPDILIKTLFPQCRKK